MPSGPRGRVWGFGAEDWERWPGAGFLRRGGHRVDRGDVKLLILTVLADGPKHGYEIIKEIERRSKGAYTPSPGTIYPTLQMLEDMGYASSHAQEERRVYEITEDGRSYVNERETSVGEAWGRFEGWDWRHLFGTDDQRQVQRELLDLGRALFAGGRILRADARMLQEVRAALRQAREKIEGTLNATGVRDGQTN